MCLISLPLVKRDLGLSWLWEWLAGAEMQRSKTTQTDHSWLWSHAGPSSWASQGVRGDSEPDLKLLCA